MGQQSSASGRETGFLTFEIMERQCRWLRQMVEMFDRVADLRSGVRGMVWS